jgi:nucleoside-diphosphate-sugar epimerase
MAQVWVIRARGFIGGHFARWLSGYWIVWVGQYSRRKRRNNQGMPSSKIKASGI